jgi:LuxR family maltose regulon positive regulatory protein
MARGMTQIQPPAAAPDAVAARRSGPRAPARVVARERLLARLVDARRRRCIVLHGPAGSGKTALALALRRELEPLGHALAWLALTPAHDEPACFVQALLATLALPDVQAVRAVPADAAAPADDSQAFAAVEAALVTVVRALAAAPGRELALVLDDLHHLTQPGVQRGLQWLLDHAPPNLHLVLLTRVPPPLSLARARAQGQTLEIGARELRFTAAETQAFLQVLLGPVERRDARALHELTDGWVAALKIACEAWQAARRRSPATTPALGPFARERLSALPALAAFFERGAIARLAADELELLTLASSCRRLCGGLGAALLDRPEAVGGVAAQLARLEAHGLFIAAEDAGSGAAAGAAQPLWYRLHPLWQAALARRFAQRPEAERRQCHARAWRWLLGHERLEDVVQQALAAGEADAAAELVAQQAQRLHDSGRTRELIRLLRLLPPAAVEARLPLRFGAALMHLYGRDFAACAAGLDRLERDIPAHDARARAALVRLRVSLAAQTDDIDRAIALRPLLLQPLPPDVDAFAVGHRNNLLSWVHLQCAEHEAARRVQHEAPLSDAEGRPLLGTASGSLQGRCLVGLSFAVEGRMAEAERVYRELLFDAEASGSAGAETLFVASALLSEALVEFNDPQGAIRLLEPRIDAMEVVSIPDSVLRGHGALAGAHWLLGHELESFAWLERLEDYAERLGLQRLLAYALGGRVRRQLARGRFEAAEAALIRLESLQAGRSATPHGVTAEVQAQALYARLRWLIAHGDLAGAEARLPLALAHARSRGDRRSGVRLQLQAVLVDARRGEAVPARARLLAALAEAHALGLVRSVLDAGPELLRLVAEAAAGGVLDPVLSFYVERLLAAEAAAVAWIAPPPQQQPPRPSRGSGAPAEPLSERERTVLELLAQALPSKRIARTLGVSYTTVKWHLKNIYAKLGVASRDEAVARMRDLGGARGPSAAEGSTGSDAA